HRRAAPAAGGGRGLDRRGHVQARRGLPRQAQERVPLIRAAVTAPRTELQRARARFVELAAGGFEEVDRGDAVELAAYGGAGERVLAAYGDAARTSAVEAGWEDRWREFHRPVRVGPLWVGPPWETAPPAPVLAVVVDPG